MKEALVEKYLVDSVVSRGGECYKLTPPPKGIQDRLVLLPGGFIAFVECKRPKGGITSEIQKFRAERTRILGQKHYQINTLTEVDALIQEWRSFIKGEQHEK